MKLSGDSKNKNWMFEKFVEIGFLSKKNKKEAVSTFDSLF
jgi:hypothetical protein